MDQITPATKVDLLIERVLTYLNSWSTRRFLLTIVVIQILFHLPIISLPPMGQHTWRQVMGTATARNFYDDNNSFFYPSQDVRIAPEDRGVIYIQLPLLSYITGLTYRITGFSYVNSRAVMLLMGIFLIFGSYKFIRSLGANEARARWFTFFLSFSPYFFYYSITVSPNMPALTWFIWGIALIIPRLEEQSWNWKFWLGILFITIGTLSKATYLFFGLPVAYLFLVQLKQDRNYKFLLVTLASFLIVIVPNILIYFHARNLYDLAPYERHKYAVLAPKYFPESWHDITATLRPGIFDWFLQMHVNVMTLPFFLVGCYAALKNKRWRSKQGQFWVMWMTGFLIFAVFFFTQFREHAYYLTPLLIFAAMGTTYGMEISLRKGKFRHLICVLLICVPIVMVGRVGHRWLWAKQVPEEFLYKLEDIQKAIPVNERVLVFGDKSPVVYLYYLHRKGVSLNTSVSKEMIKEYYDYGFRYIVSEIPLSNIPAFKGLPMNKVTRVGNFGIFRIKD